MFFSGYGVDVALDFVTLLSWLWMLGIAIVISFGGSGWLSAFSK